MRTAVIDQPGIRITILGLVLSFFLGYGFKSQISDSRVQFYLNRAIERLNSDFNIDYDRARVNLSKWGLPLPVLEVSGIRLSPKGTCQNSQVYVDELEVPISISTILGLSDKIPKIRFRNMEIRIVDSDRCHEPSVPITVPVDKKKTIQPVSKANDAAAPPPSVKSTASVKDVFTRNTRAELSEIYVEKMRIIFGQSPEQPLLLKNINVELKYAANKLNHFTLRSKFNAIRDAKSDLYYANANLNLLAKADDVGKIDTVVNIEGKLLDGDIQFFAHYLTGDTKLNYEFDLDKVSVRGLLPMIPGLVQHRTSFLERVPMSISFKNSGEFEFSKTQRIESNFKKLVVNLDNAVIKAAGIKVNSTDGKVQVSPFDFLIEGLPLTRLKAMDVFRGRLDSFESLGVLSGKLSYASDDNIRFDGILRGLEVVFSNRGRRDLQAIDEMNFHVRRGKNQLSVEANSLVVGGEKLDGVLTASHDSEKNSTQAALKISGHIFSGRIWDQFTFVEQSPKVDVSWVYRKTDVEDYVLKMKVDSLELPGVLFSNVSLDLNQSSPTTKSKGNLNLNIRPQKILTNEKFLENSYVAGVLNSSLGLKGQSFSGEKTAIQLNGQDWRNLNFNLETQLTDLMSKQPVHLSIKGSVDHFEGVRSKLALVQKNQKYRFDFLAAPSGQISISPESE